MKRQRVTFAQITLAVVQCGKRHVAQQIGKREHEGVRVGRSQLRFNRREQARIERFSGGQRVVLGRLQRFPQGEHLAIKHFALHWDLPRKTGVRQAHNDREPFVSHHVLQPNMPNFAGSCLVGLSH